MRICSQNVWLATGKQSSKWWQTMLAVVRRRNSNKRFHFLFHSIRLVSIDFLENVTNHRNVLKFPSDEDLNGAAVALTRLQDTYHLETSSIARGELNGVQYRWDRWIKLLKGVAGESDNVDAHVTVSIQLHFCFSSEMTSNDCFELGRQSYLNKDFYHTLLWMSEAMQRLHNDTTETTSTSKADILEYLAFAVFKQGEFGRAKCVDRLHLHLNEMRLLGRLQGIFGRHLTWQTSYCSWHRLTSGQSAIKFTTKKSWRVKMLKVPTKCCAATMGRPNWSDRRPKK